MSVFMKVLGNILHLAGSGKLIVKVSNTPPAGSFVFTNDKNKIGRVGGIFGPVKNPYVSINLYKSVNRRDLENRCGEKLFVSTKSENERFKKSNSKKSGSRKSNYDKHNSKKSGSKKLGSKKLGSKKSGSNKSNSRKFDNTSKKSNKNKRNKNKRINKSSRKSRRNKSFKNKN